MRPSEKRQDVATILSFFDRLEYVHFSHDSIQEKEAKPASFHKTYYITEEAMCSSIIIHSIVNLNLSSWLIQNYVCFRTHSCNILNDP